MTLNVNLIYDLAVTMSLESMLQNGNNNMDRYAMHICENFMVCVITVLKQFGNQMTGRHREYRF